MKRKRQLRTVSDEELRRRQTILNQLTPIKLVYDDTHATVILHFGWPRRNNKRLCAINRMHWLDDSGRSLTKLQLHVGGAGQEYEGLTKDLPHHRVNDGIDARPRPAKDMFRVQSFVDGQPGPLLKLHATHRGPGFVPDFLRRDVLQGTASFDFDALLETPIRMSSYDHSIPTPELAQQWIETRSFDGEIMHPCRRRRNCEARSTYVALRDTVQARPACGGVAPASTLCGLCRDAVLNRNVGGGFNARSGLYCASCRLAMCATCVAAKVLQAREHGAVCCIQCAQVFDGADVSRVVPNLCRQRDARHALTSVFYANGVDLHKLFATHNRIILEDFARALSLQSGLKLELQGCQIVRCNSFADPALQLAASSAPRCTGRHERAWARLHSLTERYGLAALPDLPPNISVASCTVEPIVLSRSADAEPLRALLRLAPRLPADSLQALTQVGPKHRWIVQQLHRLQLFPTLADLCQQSEPAFDVAGDALLAVIDAIQQFRHRDVLRKFVQLNLHA